MLVTSFVVREKRLAGRDQRGGPAGATADREGRSGFPLSLNGMAEVVRAWMPALGPTWRAGIGCELWKVLRVDPSELQLASDEKRNGGR